MSIQHTAGLQISYPSAGSAATRPVNADTSSATWPRFSALPPPSWSAAGPDPAVVLLQAVISEGASLNGRTAACGLHGLGADFDAGSLLALLTEEGAHSTNLWMQQRCHCSSIICSM